MKAVRIATISLPALLLTLLASCGGNVAEGAPSTLAAGCALDSDCPTNFLCSSGACEYSPPECTTDADCGSGSACQGGTCVMICVNSGCPAGLVCDVDTQQCIPESAGGGSGGGSTAGGGSGGGSGGGTAGGSGGGTAGGSGGGTAGGSGGGTAGGSGGGTAGGSGGGTAGGSGGGTAGGSGGGTAGGSGGGTAGGSGGGTAGGSGGGHAGGSGGGSAGGSGGGTAGGSGGGSAGGSGGGTGSTCTDTWANFAQTSFANNCVSCHSHNHSAFDSYSGVKSDISGIKSRINSGSMPEGGWATASDKSRILAWITCGEPQ